MEQLPDDQAQTHGSPDVVQAPDDVPGAGAEDPRADRAAPAETMAGSWVFVALIGVWVMLSPVAFTYGVDDSKVNVIVVGALALGIGVLGFMRLEQRRLGPATVILGIWLAASALFLAETNTVRIDSVLMGGILVILGLVGLAAASDRGRPRSI